jgi:excisionase family DNA binding protein
MTEFLENIQDRARSSNNEPVANLAQLSLEPYVDADCAAAFLNTNRLKVIRMARSGCLPAYPLGTGKRRQWRFKRSELDNYMQGRLNNTHPPVRQTKGE